MARISWQNHPIDSWLIDDDQKMPADFEIDSYWHWLCLPQAEPGETRDDQVEQPIATGYVFGFDDGTRFEEFLGWLDGRQDDKDRRDAANVILPAFYREQVFVAGSDPFEAVVLSTPALVSAIAAEFGADGYPFDTAVATGAPLPPGFPICAAPEVADPEDLLPDAAAANDVVIAIIDTDIAWANTRFRKDITSTRIAWFWDMDADCLPNQGLGVGREMFASTDWAGAESIDSRLKRFETDGMVDEAALYADYQAEAYADIGRRRAIRSATHGTHVLDCAAGAEITALCGEGQHGPDTTPIFAVQLPRLAVDETHGAFLSPYVQLALDRITFLARTLGGDETRVLVNYSFGGSAGRHDGRSQLEQDFDRRIAAGQLATINLAAGNSYESAAHARFSGDDLKAPRNLTMRVPPDDGTPNFMEIWLPVGSDVGDLRLTIEPPVGPALRLNADVPMKIGEVWQLTGERVLARLYIQSDRWPAENLRDARLKLTLAVQHTGEYRDFPNHGAGAPVVAGDWDLTFQSDRIASADAVKIWVERDDRLPGAKAQARQSYLVRRGDDADGIRPDGTISEIATGLRTVVAAGYRRSDGAPAPYSSAGFIDRSTSRFFFPTVAAASEEAPALTGIIAAGTFSGSVSRLRGTSAATGLVTRACVPIARSGQGVRAGLIAVADGDGGTPDDRLGCGRIPQAIPGRPRRRA